MADIFDLAQKINAQRRQAAQGYSSPLEMLPLEVAKIMATREENKSVRDASSMLAIAGDYTNIFDNEELDSRIDKLDQRWGGDNYKRLSADAMVQYDNTKELLLQQRRQNADFDGQYNYLNNIQSDMDSWLGNLPEDGSISSEKAEEFKSLMKRFAESRGELERKHGGRLNTTNYNTFRSNMDAITNIGMITSSQFIKDGNMSSREAEAYSNALMTYDSTPINDYNAERKAGATQERTDLRTGIKTDISTYNTMLDNYQRGGTYNKENELVMFSEDTLEEYGDDIVALQMRMENKNNKYIELGGESDYLETQGFEFMSFGEPSISETEEEKRLRLAEEEKARLSKKDKIPKTELTLYTSKDKKVPDTYSPSYQPSEDKKTTELTLYNEDSLKDQEHIDRVEHVDKWDEFNKETFSDKRKLESRQKKIESLRERGYNINEEEYDNISSQLEDLNKDIETAKQQIEIAGGKDYARYMKKILKNKKKIRDTALQILEDSGVPKTKENFKNAIIEAKRILLKERGDSWGTKTHSQRVPGASTPFYRTGSRAAKP